MTIFAISQSKHGQNKVPMVTMYGVVYPTPCHAKYGRSVITTQGNNSSCLKRRGALVSGKDQAM